MSSLTISTTVCVLAQPCCSRAGLYARTFALPPGKTLPNARCAAAAPFRSAAARAASSSGSTSA